MRNHPAHEAPADARKRRRRRTRVVLATAVTTALAGSGIYIAGAHADEVDVPGRVQAEAFAAQSGAQTEDTSDTGRGRDVGWLANGDWLRYDSVSITGAELTARIASDNAAGGSVVLHLGSVTGKVLATFPVTSTGGWQKWTTVTAKAASVPSGPQTVFAVVQSSSKSDEVNLNWFTFGPAGSGSSASGPVSAPASAPAGTPSSAPAGPPAAGYVDVDQAEWARQLAEFDAVTPQPVPAGTTRVGEFQVNCKVSNQAADDPIVLPGMPGASHMHMFFGPSVDAFTTPAKLSSLPTNCDSPGDHSVYWSPTMLRNGTTVPMKSMRVYYGTGRIKDASTIKPFPTGLEMVQGDAKLQVATPAGAPNQFWCAGSKEVGRGTNGDMAVCAPGGNIIFQLVFKSCWDGKHLDSPDHKSHMADPQNGSCPSSHPVALPEISMMLNYDTLGGDGFALSSGRLSSQHADFMNGWASKNIAALVKTCINQNAKCGTTPTFVGG